MFKFISPSKRYEFTLSYELTGMMMGNQQGMSGLQQGMQSMAINPGSMMGQPAPMMGHQMGK